MTYGSREGTVWQFLFMQYSWQGMSSAVHNTNQKVLLRRISSEAYTARQYTPKRKFQIHPYPLLVWRWGFNCEIPLSPQGLSFPKMSRSQILRQKGTVKINSLDAQCMSHFPGNVKASPAFQLLEHLGKSSQTHRCSPPAKLFIYCFCRRCCHTESAGAELQGLCMSSHCVHHRIADHKLCTVPHVVLEVFPSSNAADFCCSEGPALTILNRKKNPMRQKLPFYCLIYLGVLVPTVAFLAHDHQEAMILTVIIPTL